MLPARPGTGLTRGFSAASARSGSVRSSHGLTGLGTRPTGGGGAAVANRGHRPWNPGRAAAPWVKGSWAGTPAAGASPVSSSAEQRPAEERKHPVDGVRQPDRDPVARADPGLAEPAGHPGGAVPPLRIAD